MVNRAFFSYFLASIESGIPAIENGVTGSLVVRLLNWVFTTSKRVLPRAGDLWVQASLDQRQRFQQLFFPDGIAFDGNRFCSNRRNRTGLQLLAGNQN
jgi:hypothetical protein